MTDVSIACANERERIDVVLKVIPVDELQLPVTVQSNEEFRSCDCESGASSAGRPWLASSMEPGMARRMATGRIILNLLITDALIE